METLEARVARLGPLLAEGLGAWNERPRDGHPMKRREAFITAHGQARTREVIDTLDRLYTAFLRCEPSEAGRLSLGDATKRTKETFCKRIPGVPDKVLSSLTGRYMFENR
jgi:hypothetical protein